MLRVCIGRLFGSSGALVAAVAQRVPKRIEHEMASGGNVPQFASLYVGDLHPDTTEARLARPHRGFARDPRSSERRFSEHALASGTSSVVTALQWCSPTVSGVEAARAAPMRSFGRFWQTWQPLAPLLHLGPLLMFASRQRLL